MTSILIVDSREETQIDITISLPPTAPNANCFNQGRAMKRAGKTLADCICEDQQAGLLYQHDFQHGCHLYQSAQSRLIARTKGEQDGYDYMQRCANHWYAKQARQRPSEPQPWQL